MTVISWLIEGVGLITSVLPLLCLRPVTGVDKPQLLIPGASSCLSPLPSLASPSGNTALFPHKKSCMRCAGNCVGVAAWAWPRISNWSASLLDNASFSAYCLPSVLISLYSRVPRLISVYHLCLAIVSPVTY